MNPKRIVITGGPATGKTSIIDRLKELDFVCYEEVIRKLTTEAQESGDITEEHSNPIALVDDSVLFNTKLLQLRLDDFKDSVSLNKDVVFFDRGMPDVLAYMDFFNQDITENFIETCELYKYDCVFILPPWEAIYQRDGERFETFEQASDLYFHLNNTYRKFGYHTVEVPFGSVIERTDFILGYLNKLYASY
ncbi:MAG: ATP-binding protein [Winogradskyella sp.]|uniref:ATP-binding protein n=1 Tax=Winogradskyella sp. TaxID=1883156 RepID=UPI0025DCF85C|nr:ATP-binding protein [Winogradskyella sp.]NRB61209.1 ATP-binding protein [Winogradskyella sp.]